MSDGMITESHMTMLREELAELRDHMQSGGTDEGRIGNLLNMTEKMSENAADGPFEKQLTLIQGLLRAVAENTHYQIVIRKYAAAFDRLGK
ncbi:MAG: hypothetical protein CMJ19_00220 [Phycisphaeraceae bacterium]|mgnify:CR=1 FL=1|nr:hypothetical protein [Phycisphaeraceae bacterium]